MVDRKFAATLLAALVLVLGAGYAAADDMESSMEEADRSGMSGAMDDGDSGMGDDMDEMNDAAMSDSMADESPGMTGDMDDDASSMGDGM